MKHTLAIQNSFYSFVLLLALASCQSAGEGRFDSFELRYAERITQSHELLLGQEYQRVAVDASVYKGLMEMLGVGERCLDFSADMKPDVERIIASKADLLLLSAYEGVDTKKYRDTGIPLVECTDFLESSPLARAEWMRYFGRLWGVGERADSLFSVVEGNLNSMANTSANEKLIIFDTLYGNQWYQSVENSTIGQLVAIAGGKVIGGKEQDGGSVAFSAEQMLMKAKDADYWLIRFAGNNELTLDALSQMNPVYSQFKAFKEGRVYVCYTDRSNYFEETPFRPDYLLEDILKIMSQEFADNQKMRYFCRVK